MWSNHCTSEVSSKNGHKQSKNRIDMHSWAASILVKYLTVGPVTCFEVGSICYFVSSCLSHMLFSVVLRHITINFYSLVVLFGCTMFPVSVLLIFLPFRVMPVFVSIVVPFGITFTLCVTFESNKNFKTCNFTNECNNSASCIWQSYNSIKGIIRRQNNWQNVYDRVELSKDVPKLP